MFVISKLIARDSWCGDFTLETHRICERYNDALLACAQIVDERYLRDPDLNQKYRVRRVDDGYEIIRIVDGKLRHRWIITKILG